MSGLSFQALDHIDRPFALERAQSLQESELIGAPDSVRDRVQVTRVEAKFLTWGELLSGHEHAQVASPPCPVDPERIIWVVSIAGALPLQPVAQSPWRLVPWKMISLDAQTGDRLCEELRPTDDLAWPAVFDELPDHRYT